MQGTTLTRSLNAFRHMLLEPKFAARWAGERLRPTTPLQRGLPWTSWPSIEYLQKRLRPGMRVFEWGGGGSTVFFLRLGCSVATVESDRVWRDRISEAISRETSDARGRWDLRFVRAEAGGMVPVTAYVEAVKFGAPWDLILVDGIDEPHLNSCLLYTSPSPRDTR